jgi:uncharacterized protein
LSNRLAQESSPYLLLHAENPVDWYPWGDEAFEKARREGKPVFLSVGYSTCYWCHVMERESFSNPEIARQLNESFVPIKLDREERPDLDEIYMAATQLLTRAGGWPNSVFLTPDGKPFFAGTYFPPEDRYGRPGFPRVLAALREAWQTRPEEIRHQADVVAEAIQEHLDSAAVAAEIPDAGVAEAAQGSLADRFDRRYGGFGAAPKFPSPSNLFFLLDLAPTDAQAREMLVVTLDRMARGGIHDQLGGGFHRYSTDAEWLVPHFEKMLYDNASLAALFAEASALAPDLGFERVARATLDFVLHELTSPEGGFLSAIDAETHGHEGAYYTWTKDELQSLLEKHDYPLLASVYGFDGRPNFEADRYVLNLPEPLSDRARERGLSVEELLARLEPGRKALLEARWKRPRPLVDDKVLADWNGLMILGMARAGARLGEESYVDAARRAAAFVLSRLVDSASGTLLHVYRAGKAKVPALLDDYAFLIQGLLELHAATGEERWLDEAVRLHGEQDARLGDAKGGYFAAGENPELLVRAKPGYDGALSSGNGITALNLLELAERTGNPSCRARADAVLGAFASAIGSFPLAHVTLVRALLRRASTASFAARSLDTLARGVVTAQGRLEAGTGAWRPFAVELTIREGWHVNANPASEPTLVPTSLAPERGAVRSLRYPEGEPFGPEAEAVAVYRGRVRLVGEVEVAEGSPTVRLTYQACDDSRCLPPVTEQVTLQ